MEKKEVVPKRVIFHFKDTTVETYYNRPFKPLLEEVRIALRWGADELTKQPKKKLSLTGRKKSIDLPPAIRIRDEDINEVEINIQPDGTTVRIQIEPDTHSCHLMNKNWFNQTVKQFQIMQAVKVYEDV